MARLTARHGPPSGSRSPSADDVVVPVRHRVYRVRQPADPKFFTDSALIFMVKTIWARLTAPRAVAGYRAALAEFLETFWLTAQTSLALVLALLRAVWGLGAFLVRVAGRGLGVTARAAHRCACSGGRVGVDGARATGNRVADGARGIKRRVAVRAQAGAQKIAERARASGGQATRRVRVGWRPLVVGARAVRLRPSRWASRWRARSAGIARAAWRLPGAIVSGAVRFGVIWSASRSGLRRAGSRLRRAVRELVTSLRRGLRYSRTVAAPLALAVLLTLVAPIVRDLGTELETAMASRLSSLPTKLPRIDLPKLSLRLPRLSLPKVTLHKPELPRIPSAKLAGANLALPELSLPDVALPAPTFILTRVRRLEEVLAGPLVARGGRVVVADLVEADGDVKGLGRVLALALEAELASARRFRVIRRERALAAPRRGEAQGYALPASEALAVARAMGADALVSGRIDRAQGAYVLSLVARDPSGAERYRTRVEASADELLADLSLAARELERRLGADERAMAEGLSAAVPVLSSSLAGLRAYGEARASLYRGRYRSSVIYARRAVRHDSAFAAAYQVLAEAYALSGRRADARRALEQAWRFRDRLPERERLRLAADRAAFAGRFSEAILAYDRLFGDYRDDVRALRSQAVLQGMIGARGRGAGNLQVASAIDPADWPPLTHVARFLGYRGRLPRPDPPSGPSG